jgi:hypothetical protein
VVGKLVGWRRGEERRDVRRGEEMGMYHHQSRRRASDLGLRPTLKRMNERQGGMRRRERLL